MGCLGRDMHETEARGSRKLTARSHPVPRLLCPQALLLLGLNAISASFQDQPCESLSLASNISGLQCNASVDLIGTCWPRSPAGQLVVRPCPAYFYGVRYNTTSKEASGGRTICRGGTGWEELGTCWSGCRGAAMWEPHVCPSLLPQKKSKVHYHVAVIINYLGHCVSLVALLVAFVLFLRL
ncbi:corticotropin-releasing factor, partial [Lynx pardinus]